MKKKLCLVFVSAFLFACAKDHAKTAAPTLDEGGGRKPATAGLEPLKSDLHEFAGVWRRTGGAESHVVVIGSHYKDEDTGVVTKAHGIDLHTVFGYGAIPLAEDDAVVLKRNPDRKVVEGLLRKTLDGEPSLFEMVFTTPAADRLRIEIRMGDKSVAQEFVRASDEWAAAEEFLAQHERLFLREIRAYFDGRVMSSICTAKDGWDLEGNIHSRDLKCVQAMVKGGLSLNRRGLLREAIRVNDPGMVQFLLQNSVAIDAEALREGSGTLFESLGFAEHGQANTWILRKRIQKLLIQAGADFNERGSTSASAFGAVLSYGGDAEVLEMMLDRGADPNCDCGDNGKKAYLTFMMKYQDRWGSKGPALLERLLKAGIDPNAEGFLQYAVVDGDVPSLKILSRYGAKLKRRGWEGEALTAIAEAKKNLKEPLFSGYTDQVNQIRKIKRLEENLAYLKSL